MNTDRIKEIQQETAYPESQSVQQALLKVWNETEQSLKAGHVETLIIDHLRSKSTEAYLNYIRLHKKQECLGFEAKIASGEFGTHELESHKKAQEWYGKHCAYSDAIRIINDIGL